MPIGRVITFDEYRGATVDAEAQYSIRATSAQELECLRACGIAAHVHADDIVAGRLDYEAWEVEERDRLLEWFGGLTQDRRDDLARSAGLPTSFIIDGLTYGELSTMWELDQPDWP